jgi:Domain of unknown function (DUF4190)
MTQSSDPPSDKHENLQGTPPSAPSYPNPYQPGPYPGGYPPPQQQPYSGYSPQPQPYSGYSPQPQPYSGYPTPGVAPKNGLGIASLIVAILALLSSWTIAGGIILGLAALIIGFVARGRVKRGEATNGGVAIAGIVLGALGLVVGLAFIAVWLVFFKDVGGGDFVSCLQKAGSDPVKQQQCQQQFQQRVDNQFSITPTPSSKP